MSAAILILITLSQLMLTPSASILNEIINDLTFFKSELNTFMAQDGNTSARSASGEFVRPPKVVDTTIIKNKLHELQNNVTKLAEAISNKNQNADDIKNKFSSMEKEIEDIRKMYDDKDREITQTLQNFRNIISDLLAKYKNREQEIAKLQDEEFLETIKYKYYQFAAAKFTTMKNETRAMKLISSVYEELGDLTSMLEFADNVNDFKRKLLIYGTIIKSNTFQQCQDCNIMLICQKMTHFYGIVVGGELEYLLYEIFITLNRRANHLECGGYSMKIYPEWVKNLVETYCSSGNQLEPFDKPTIHEYSGYCYPIDSVYSLLQ